MKYILFILLLLNGLQAWSQAVKGRIRDSQRQPLVGVSVHSLQTYTGTLTDAEGRFEITDLQHYPFVLVVSYVGYVNDSIEVTSSKDLEIVMKTNAQLSEVVVNEQRVASSFSTIDPMNRQSLSTTEFKKSACCNLSESFETNATVDVSYTDAISGSKQIKMLGLDGSYTQVLHELMPGIRGLSTVTGYAHIPGTWVSSIDITKGAGSVVSGYESISGQINIDLLKPEKADRFHLNVYAGDAGRFETNMHLAHRFSKKWSSILLTHGSGVIARNDFNGDGYLDVPISSQFNVMNKWKFESPGKLMAMFGFHALVDDRQGGQVRFKNKEDNDAGRMYGVNIHSTHLEAFSKTGFGFDQNLFKSIGLMSNLRSYEQNAWYGFKTYRGQERTLTLNLIYQNIYNTNAHKFKAGSSYMLDSYNETYRDSNFTRAESVPGIFGEYNYDRPNKMSLLAGLRIDHHSIYGAMINPRVHFKYHLLPRTVVRASAGRGMRVANIFIENAATLASSREVIVLEQLRPEVAWNYGVTFTHKFTIFKQGGTFNVDFFRTDFENQVVADLDANPQQIIFYNLRGSSFSNSFQAELNYEPLKKFEVRLAYKWQDVRVTYHGELLQKPLIARDRVLLNLAYATKFDKWKFDFTAKWFGQNRIPNTSSNPDGQRFEKYSRPYYVFNTQATRAFKKFEVYLGVENIFDFVQTNQIIDPANPFGAHFDASMIWGPVMGRVIYTGLRYTIK